MPRKKLPEKRERMIHVRLTDELHKRLKVEVASKGQTIQDWVLKLIDQRLAKSSKIK
jgi:predicted HicB family RNase H-like nuclease